MTTDDQQSVTMIREDTDSQDNVETDHAYDQSYDQEAIMGILCPDLDSDSGSDKDDSLFGTEWLYNLGVTDHILSNMQVMKGKLATLIIKLFNTEPVLTVFDTGATCPCISFNVYHYV